MDPNSEHDNSGAENAKSTNAVETKSVAKSLELVLGSSKFMASPMMSQFLRYVVEEKLAGRESDLKSYTIAVDAIGRPEDFDPQKDPTVRVLAGRLRSALDLYYSGEGVNDPVIITIPIGKYEPHFAANGRYVVEAPSPPSTQAPVSSAAPRLSAGWLSIAAAFLAILGVGYAFLFWDQINENFNQTAENKSDKIIVAIRGGEHISSNQPGTEEALQFSRSLRAALSRNDALLIVLESKSAPQDSSSQTAQAADFIVDSKSQSIGASREVSIELINARTNSIVWARAYKLSVDEDATDSKGKVVTQVVRELNTQIFGASIRALEGRDPNRLSASQLFVLATWVPGAAKNTLAWEKERIELARLALKKDPDFGPAHSVLADKLAYLAAVDGPSDTIGARAEAKTSARRALELDAADANVLFNVAQYYWHSGNLDNAIRTFKRILELDPNHGFARFFSTVIPFTCNAAPDKVLKAAIDFDKSLDADNPIRWVTLTWTGWLHLNRSEFGLALDAEQRAAQIFQIPYTVMRHATILNVLGREHEASELVHSQRTSWPNIDAAHFSEVTMPRLCRERPNSEKMIGFYEDLTKTLKKKTVNK